MSRFTESVAPFTELFDGHVQEVMLLLKARRGGGQEEIILAIHKYI